MALDEAGRLLVTCLGEDAIVTDLRNGKQLARIEGVSISGCNLSRIDDQTLTGDWSSRMEKSSLPYVVCQDQP